MAEVFESKRCLMFTVNNWNEVGFDSVFLYAFDESFLKLEDEGKRKSANKKSGNEAAFPISCISDYYSYASFGTINSMIYRVGGSFYTDIMSRVIWTAYSKSSSRKPVEREYLTLLANFCQEGRTCVDYCDMFNDKNWEEGLELRFPRRNPHLLVLGGKIYVTGGFLQMPEDFSFMEVLDVKTAFWEMLPNPPVAVEKLDYFLSASVEALGFILIVTGREAPQAYTYKPNESVWQPFEDVKFREEMVFDYHSRPAVTVGKVVLWTDDHRGTSVVGVDLSSRQWFGFDMAREGLLHTPCLPNDFPRLVHFGNNELCLLWRDTQKYACKSQDNGNEETSCAGYHCVKFCVALDQRSRGKLCDLKVVSRRKCLAPAAPHKLGDAFVVNIGIPKNNRSFSHLNSLWGVWGGLSVTALMAYFLITRRR